MKTFTAVVLAALIGAAPLWAGSIGDQVEVRIISDTGMELSLYPVPARAPAKKVYAEAVKGDHYKIMVCNRLNRRVGVVIAVDGRNIVSGQKSWLKSSERMYILEPYATYEYAGWRTGQDRINRFFFTEAPDSYAAAFRDRSAMGVIAVAVYPERQRGELLEESGRQGPPEASSAPSVPRDRGASAAPGAKAERADRSAGTGYGRTEYSPSRIVAFDPEPRAVETLYIKYEWRSTLCRLGVISRCRTYSHPFNRLWDNDGYAPPPPGRE
ncbi:MAG TPA: hypothetical protein DCS11_08975 [Syntrophus sp. (in: bacteria)]|nr:hypothetical protein [Syntrophus sp. (in: bacteria)]